MRVVGLVSSPRKGGNSELAVKEIMNCLPADWEKVMLRLNELNIEDCNACYKCVPSGAKCPIKDDLDLIIRNIKHSDKVVIAFPAYIFTAPGPVKTIMDRLISITSDHRTFPKSDCVMVLSYGMDGWDGMIKEDAIVLANKLHLNLLDARPILATLPGDSVQGENLEIVRGLAKMLEEGRNDIPVPGPDAADSPLTCPHCSSTAMKIYPGGRLRCSVCGGTSSLHAGDGGFSVSADAEDHPGYFTEQSLDEHVDYLTEKKNLFIQNVRSIKELQAGYEEPDRWIHPEN